VTGGQIADDAVTTAKILDDNVTLAKMAGGTQGDTLYYGAAGAPTLLAKPGTPADEVLTFATGASAPSWVASAAGGKVLQVVHDDIVGASSTSTSYVATGLTVTITPSAVTSVILLQVSGGMSYSSAANAYIYTTFYVGAVPAEVSPAGPYERTRMNAYDEAVSHSAVCIHEPATTSATTYYVYFKTNIYGSTAYWTGNSVRAWLTAMEIGA
jgi:hypothetical protein